jgi:hypothetical protein
MTTTSSAKRNYRPSKREGMQAETKWLLVCNPKASVEEIAKQLHAEGFEAKPSVIDRVCCWLE